MPGEEESVYGGGEMTVSIRGHQGIDTLKESGTILEKDVGLNGFCTGN